MADHTAGQDALRDAHAIMAHFAKVPCLLDLLGDEIGVEGCGCMGCAARAWIAKHGTARSADASTGETLCPNGCGPLQQMQMAVLGCPECGERKLRAAERPEGQDQYSITMAEVREIFGDFWREDLNLRNNLIDTVELMRQDDAASDRSPVAETREVFNAGFWAGRGEYRNTLEAWHAFTGQAPPTLEQYREAASAPDEGTPLVWAIVFDDPDMRHEVFSGEGAEEAARARYAHLCQAWTCWLFVSVRDPDATRREAASAPSPAAADDEPCRCGCGFPANVTGCYSERRAAQGEVENG